MALSSLGSSSEQRIAREVRPHQAVILYLMIKRVTLPYGTTVS